MHSLRKRFFFFFNHKGKKTSKIQSSVDKDGRQRISFFCKTAESEKKKPLVAKFSNDCSEPRKNKNRSNRRTYRDDDDDADDDDTDDDVTVSDDDVMSDVSNSKSRVDEVEGKVEKGREAEGDMYKGKESFVTSA